MSPTANQLREDAKIEEDIENLLSGEQFEKAAERMVQSTDDPTRLVRVYSMADGEPRDVLAWTVQGKNSILRRRLEDGRRAFTVNKEDAPAYAIGDMPCHLNPKHPYWQEYLKMGIPNRPCPAEHLSSVFSQEIHMQHRHSQEWAIIKTYQERLREDEYREFQRLQADAARSMIAANGGGKTPGNSPVI